MGLSSLSKVLYCGPEDSFFRKLTRPNTRFSIETKPISYKTSPQQFARGKKASVLIVRIKNEFNLKEQDWFSLNDASVPVIILCQNGTVQTAVHALQYGVFDYFSLSTDPEVVFQRIVEAVEWAESKTIRRKPETHDQILIGADPQVREISFRAKNLAKARCPVLLCGEPGTGKHHLAYGMYKVVFKDMVPFVHYDCRLLQQVTRYDGTSVSEQIIGLRKRWKSKALKGVLYLSHLESLSIDQQKEILKSWGNGTPIRLIASTQSQAVSFDRDDPALPMLELPALRARVDDIPLIAEHFVRKIAATRKMRQKSFSVETVKLMQGYSWPGNIQELANVVERMMVIEPSGILSANTWRICQGSTGSVNQDAGNRLSVLIENALQSDERWDDGMLYKKFMARAEKMLIELVLPKVNHNQGTAAKVLGISRNTLREKRRA